MPFIETVEPERATGRLRELYDAAIRRAGRVFGIVRIMSLEPVVLEASMDLYRKVMYGSGGLSRREREMLAVVVSKANGCHY